MYTIVLEGKPKSTNTIYKTALKNGKPILYMTTEGKTVKEQYMWEMKSQVKHQPYKGNIEIEIHLYFNDHRKRDWDNYNKIVCDSGNGIIWQDDKQIKVGTVYMKFDKERPHIELSYKII